MIDGPGNSLAAYFAAVLTLHTLVKRHGRVAVCCHSGSRSLAVCLMYLHTVSERGWDNWLAMLSEKIDEDLPGINVEHKNAFNKINWRLLSSMMGDR